MTIEQRAEQTDTVEQPGTTTPEEITPETIIDNQKFVDLLNRMSRLEAPSTGE